MSTTDHTAITDHDLTEMFDLYELCEIGASEDSRCPNRARFYVICHDCSHGLACALHLDALLHQVSSGASVQCNWCGKVFASIDQAMSVVEL